MPVYHITDPKTGQSIDLRGEGGPPTEAELEQIFASLPPSRSTSPMNPELARVTGQGTTGADELARITPIPGRAKYLPAAGAALLGTGMSLATGGLGAAAAIPLVGLAGAGGAGFGAAVRDVMGGNPQTPSVGQNVKDMTTGAATQASGETLGRGVSALASKVAPWLMQSALKPTQTTLNEYRTTAPALTQTLLDNGVSVTPAGLHKLDALLSENNAAIANAVQNAPGDIPMLNVARRLNDVAGRATRQVNPQADLEAISQVGENFLNHPGVSGTMLTVPEAQAMKQETYRRLAGKYGELSGASIEAEKGLARGLKEEVAARVPGVADLNARDAQLMAAADAVGRRVGVAGNRDPVGFAWAAASRPQAFIAALMDRNPAVKSAIARGAWALAGRLTGVPGNVIAGAVATIASGDDSASGPARPPQTGNPTGR